MEIHFKLIGVLLILLALMHTIFPRYFRWKEELGTLSLVNKEMMIVHTFFIGVTVFLMGILCLTAANDLIQTPLGKNISLGFGIFWFLRLIVQFFGYSSTLWKGKVFETVVHVLFTVLWFYLSVIFLLNAMR